jgi:hypothetical protein
MLQADSLKDADAPAILFYDHSRQAQKTLDFGFLGATEQKTGISSEYRFANVYISANSRRMR